MSLAEAPRVRKPHQHATGGHGHRTYKDPRKDELETLSDLQKDRRREELDLQSTRDLLTALRKHHPEGDPYTDYRATDGHR